MSTKIYVVGLAQETTEAELGEFFTKHGTIVSVNIMTDEATKNSKGFGFVQMEKAEEAQKALTTLNGKELGGRKLSISQARPGQNNAPRAGFARNY